MSERESDKDHPGNKKHQSSERKINSLKKRLD